MRRSPALRLLHRIQGHHSGYNVYHSKEACLAALREIEKERTSWWSAECSAFVQSVAEAPVVSSSPRRFPIIVIEGLDGVGKTTVVNSLIERLNGVLVRTPNPSLEGLRSLFRTQAEPISRAFYCGANYLAAPTMVSLAQEKPVVVDRWWCSTCAMSLASSCALPERLPPRGDAVYQWPSDLPRFEVGALLHVDEFTRRQRMKKRNDEHAEEALLAASESLRAAAMEAYQRFGLLDLVEVPNYRHAVNDILKLVHTKGGMEVPKSRMFTPDELLSVKPY